MLEGFIAQVEIKVRSTHARARVHILNYWSFPFNDINRYKRYCSIFLAFNGQQRQNDTLCFTVLCSLLESSI